MIKMNFTKEVNTFIHVDLTNLDLEFIRIIFKIRIKFFSKIFLFIQLFSHIYRIIV